MIILLQSNFIDNIIIYGSCVLAFFKVFIIQLNSFYRFKFLQKYYFKYKATKHFFFASIYFWIRCLCSKTNSLTKIFFSWLDWSYEKNRYETWVYGFSLISCLNLQLNENFFCFNYIFNFLDERILKLNKLENFQKNVSIERYFSKNFFSLLIKHQEILFAYLK